MKKDEPQSPVFRITVDIAIDSNKKLNNLMKDFKISKSAAVRKAIYLISALADNKISMIDKKGEKIKLLF
jgi:hypothetical protein